MVHNESYAGPNLIDEITSAPIHPRDENVQL